jgi:hypothetical protein
VIAVNGAWGTGKSSVAVMVKEALENQVELVEFEPWLVNSQELLVGEFFSALGEKLFSEGNSAGAMRFKHYASKYARGGAAIGLAALSAVAATILPKAAAAAVDTVATAASKSLTSEADGEISLKQLKSQIITDAAARAGKPILVLIDDIDRLSHEEIRVVLQLVKACANFPGVRYLLLYDREQVCAALKGSVGSPEAFLEKIVNQAFDLPEATLDQRQYVLVKALDRLDIGTAMAEDEAQRYSSVVTQVLLPGLHTVRHVKRYVSTVSSLLPGVIGNGFRKVDLGDFLSLEFIRQYIPTLYAVLRNEAAPQPGAYLAKLKVDQALAPDLIEEARAGVLKDLKQPIRELAKYALQNLSDMQSIGPRAKETRRFAAEFWRPAYFGFSETRAGVAEEDWISFRQSLTAGGISGAWLLDLEDPLKRERWGASVSARHMELSWTECQSLTRALLRWGETHNHEDYDLFFGRWTAWEWFCDRIISTILLESGDLDPASELLSAGRDAKSVVALGFVVGLEKHNSIKALETSWSFARGFGKREHNKSLEELVNFSCEQMKLLVSTEQAWEQPDISVVNKAVYYLLGEEAAAGFRDSAVVEKGRLERFLEQIVGPRPVAWSGERKDLTTAILNLDPESISPAAKIARQHVINALDEPHPLRRRLRPDPPPSL